ncbi:TPA: glycosyltransferase family 4 protein, partial [Klebsiella pneumoniae]|nr:glycosyltransferase family 4 protein [Klebsiella pneumoniae]
MKKILVVFHDPNIRSGATASMLTIMDALINNDDIIVEALIPHKTGELFSILKEKKVAVHKYKYYTCRYNCDTKAIFIPIRYTKALLKVGVSFFSAIVWLIKNRERFNVVYSNTSDIYIGAFISILAKIPHIWHLREFGIEDQNCRHIVGDKLFYKFAGKFSKRLICISQALKRKVIRFVDDSKVRVVYNDIILSSNNGRGYQARTLGGAMLFKPKILIAGSLIPGKGQLDVILAINELKNIGVMYEVGIAGDDTTAYANFLKNQVKELKLEKDVKFLGYISDLQRLRSEYNIGVISSNAEAFGRVTIEGMLAGLVMVATDTGANPELIDHSQSGYLYRNNDVSDLTKVLKYLHEHQSIWPNIIKNANEISKKYT